MYREPLPHTWSGLIALPRTLTLVAGSRLMLAGTPWSLSVSQLTVADRLSRSTFVRREERQIQLFETRKRGH